MIHVRRVAYIVIGIGVAVLLWQALPQGARDTKTRIVVVNAETKKPLMGVMLSARKQGILQWRYLGKTDGDGRLAVVLQENAGNFEFEVTAPGFERTDDMTGIEPPPNADIVIVLRRSARGK